MARFWSFLGLVGAVVGGLIIWSAGLSDGATVASHAMPPGFSLPYMAGFILVMIFPVTRVVCDE